MKEAKNRLKKGFNRWWRKVCEIRRRAKNDVLSIYDNLCLEYGVYKANAIVTLAFGLPGAWLAMLLFGAECAFAGAVVAVTFVTICFAVPSMKNWFKNVQEDLKELDDTDEDDEIPGAGDVAEED